MLERQCAYLFRQFNCVAAHDRSECTAATPELRHARRTVPRTTGPFLGVHLFTGAPDLRAPFGLVGAALTLRKLPVDATLDDVGTGLEAENCVRQRCLACFFAVEGDDLELHHSPSFFFFAAAAALSAAFAA